MSNPAGVEEIPEGQRQMMEDLAYALDKFFNPDVKPGETRKIGFFLTVFEFNNEDGRFNYISNANALDVKKMLQDIVARIEEREKSGNL